MKYLKHQACLKSIQQLIRLPLMFVNGGFTLIEILVAVLIIGILAAVAVPQYQRAVLKSRFAALMPIAKSLADSNEAYYLEYGEYADNAQDLPVQGRQNYPDGTEIEFGTTTDYAYVLASNPGVENNVYVVYQKHSENFPGNIHCEALTEDTLANQVCQSFGGTPLEGSLGGEDYTAYLLSGSTGGQFPKPCTTEPDTKQACSACGFMTREATCNTQTGEWEYDGDFDPETCPTQPNPETGASCGEGYTGNLTRAATCSSDHTGWEYTGDWSRSACVEIPTCTGAQPANTKAACEKGYSGTRTGTYSCKSGEWVVTWDTSTCVEADGHFNNSGFCTSSSTEDCSSNGQAVYSCVATTEGTCNGNNMTTSDQPYCTAEAEYSCSNGYFSGRLGGTCNGNADNSCSSNTFARGGCEGKGENSCSGNTFGNQTRCNGSGINSCNNNTFTSSGTNAYVTCIASATGACSNNTFTGQRANCKADVAGSCLNNTYTDGAACEGTYCPAGSFYGKYSDYDYRCNNGNGGFSKQACVAGTHFSNTECFSGDGRIGSQYCTQS